MADWEAPDDDYIYGTASTEYAGYADRVRRHVRRLYENGYMTPDFANEMLRDLGIKPLQVNHRYVIEFPVTFVALVSINAANRAEAEQQAREFLAARAKDLDFDDMDKRDLRPIADDHAPTFTEGPEDAAAEEPGDKPATLAALKTLTRRWFLLSTITGPCLSMGTVAGELERLELGSLPPLKMFTATVPAVVEATTSFRAFDEDTARFVAQRSVAEAKKTDSIGYFKGKKPIFHEEKLDVAEKSN